jgi:CHASE2 domain-containing sensor protein
LNKKVILPALKRAPLYKELHNTQLSILSVAYEATSQRSIKTFNTNLKQKESVAYALYKEMAGGDICALQQHNIWIDQAFSNRIIYKEFEGNSSYYSGLSRVSLEDFLTGDDSYTDAILLFGRVDSDAHDFFTTPIGVLPGIYIHANAVMSMFYYGAIKSYYLLNLFLAFVLGMSFTLVFEYLKQKTDLNEGKEELIAAFGIVVFSSLCIGISYFLLENYSLWLDYQKVVFVFSMYEFMKLLSQFIRRIKR